MTFPKHEVTKTRTKKQPVTVVQTMPDNGIANAIDRFATENGLADAVERFASIFSTYVTQARNGDNGASLFTEPKGYPVKVALTSLDGEDEALLSLEIEFGGPVAHSIADSLKRIADAITGQPKAA